METVVPEFTSRVLRMGKRGRPPMEAHSTLTLRMNSTRHTQMVHYCVEKGVSQRLFFETAGQRLLENPRGSLELIRTRRKAKVHGAQDLGMHTLRMNRRLKEALVQFCLDQDVSQREFVELAVEMLVRDAEFARRLQARRRNMDASRAHYLAARYPTKRSQ